MRTGENVDSLITLSSFNFVIYDNIKVLGTVAQLNFSPVLYNFINVY